MIKVMFVCHGNICRSPMAEFIFKDMVKKAGLEDKFRIKSSATSYEEIGNPVYPPAKAKLREKGLSCEGKYSVHFEMEDYLDNDYILIMDDRNLRNILKITHGQNDGRIKFLMSFAGSNAPVSDPWFSGDFDTVYDDIYAGCSALLEHIKKTI